jgi:hypothetical protein
VRLILHCVQNDIGKRVRQLGASDPSKPFLNLRALLSFVPFVPFVLFVPFVPKTLCLQHTL